MADSDLHFQNAVFNKHLNITVRQGDKWHGTHGTVDVMDDAGKDFLDKYRGQAYVLGTLLLLFDDIPAGILRHEHDPSCRTKAGLKDELQRIYGPMNDMKFALQKWTVLLFQPSHDFRLS